VKDFGDCLQVEPEAQQEAPFQPVPPHCPYTTEQLPLEALVDEVLAVVVEEVAFVVVVAKVVAPPAPAPLPFKSLLIGVRPG
jgi:hypothetical protein